MFKDKPVVSRRKFPRKLFRRSMSYMTAGKAEVVDGVEIGEGGISFRSNALIEFGQKLIINFFLQDGDFFSVCATLRSSQEVVGYTIYGISFDEVSLALKRQIRAYVARNSSDQTDRKITKN